MSVKGMTVKADDTVDPAASTKRGRPADYPCTPQKRPAQVATQWKRVEPSPQYRHSRLTPVNNVSGNYT